MPPSNKNRVNLKTVAERVGLAPCSVSAVLNQTPASRTIPPATRERILRAASELNYRPNFWARSLRTKRTRMIAALARDFGHPAIAKVVAAAQDRLHRRGYLLVLEKLSGGSTHFQVYAQERGIEGLIAVDTVLPDSLDFPSVSVDLGFLASTTTIGEGLELWFQDLGASAAEGVMAQIEGTNSAIPIRPQPTTTPFEDIRAANQP